MNGERCVAASALCAYCWKLEYISCLFTFYYVSKGLRTYLRSPPIHSVLFFPAFLSSSAFLSSCPLWHAPWHARHYGTTASRGRGGGCCTMMNGTRKQHMHMLSLPLLTLTPPPLTPSMHPCPPFPLLDFIPFTPHTKSVSKKAPHLGRPPSGP
jgi:hypothetical protein